MKGYKGDSGKSKGSGKGGAKKLICYRYMEGSCAKSKEECSFDHRKGTAEEIRKRPRGMQNGLPAQHLRQRQRFVLIGKTRVNVRWAMPASSRIQRKGEAKANEPVDKQAATVTLWLPPSPSNSTGYRPKKTSAMSGSMS